MQVFFFLLICHGDFNNSLNEWLELRLPVENPFVLTINNGNKIKMNGHING